MYNKGEQTDKGESLWKDVGSAAANRGAIRFMCFLWGLLALSLVLLITVVVLGFKLKSARSDLAAAQTKIEQLRGGQADRR